METYYLDGLGRRRLRRQPGAGEHRGTPALRDPTGTVANHSSEVARFTTAHDAEWLALLRCIELAGEHGAGRLICHCDAETVIRQFIGEYAIRQETIRALYDEAHRLLLKVPGGVGVLWIPRTENQDADALVCATVGMPQAPITPCGTMVPWRPVEMRDGPEFSPVPNPLAEHLRALCENPSLGFQDYVALHVGGQDEYSHLRGPALHAVVARRWGIESLEWMRAALSDRLGAYYARTAMRWAARGLTPPAAPKKASVVQEMAGTAKRGIGAWSK